ncbi:MAG: S46 family peptidase [Polyangiaceae bacterium]|nr:S46 family peptidase [Polyangiaceae bacterium]
MRRATLTAFVCSWLTAACSPAAPLSQPPSPTPPEPVVHDPPPSAPTFENPGGMWLPGQLAEPMHQQAFERLGVKLTPEQLTKPFEPPLGAVVYLGGCSASFVSTDGLIITNHHCVTGALQYSSTPEDDLVNNGFLAKTRKAERSNGPAARVYVTQRYEDVTDKVREGLDKITDPAKRYLEIEKREKALIKACEEKTRNVRCQVSDFFGGSRYQLIERLELRDIRLVYAPHRGVGNFGGEIDNWRWPRHTGDYGFYRAYVGKDGQPADYAEDNVPYHPKYTLKLPTQPLEKGDFVMVTGYPANTSRLATAFEVKEAVEWYYPKRIALCEHYLPVLEAIGKSDPDAALKATPWVRGLGNVLTYTKGALEGLTQGGTAELKSKDEAALKAFIEADAERKAKWGDVFQRIEELEKTREKSRETDVALFELGRLSTLLGAAEQIVHLAEERPKPDAERDPGYQERDLKQLKQGMESLDKRYSKPLDQRLLYEALIRAAKLPKEQQPKLVGYFVGAKLDEAKLKQKVDAVFEKTKLGDAKTRVALLEKATTAQLKANRDPLIQAALVLRQDLEAKDQRTYAHDGAWALIGPKYFAALKAFKNAPIAPDANRTLRITYGTVRGYSPKPGAPVYEPFTSIDQVKAKITGKEPFDPPPRLAKAIDAGKFGPFASKSLGTLPVDFLADLDISGGNSGSPTLNAKGELVGLAFDGNYEAMASDWLFMPAITRSIHVDIRYVLWLMDAVDHADDLLKEMGVTPSID